MRIRIAMCRAGAIVVISRGSAVVGVTGLGAGEVVTHGGRGGRNTVL